MIIAERATIKRPPHVLRMCILLIGDVLSAQRHKSTTRNRKLITSRKKKKKMQRRKRILVRGGYLQCLWEKNEKPPSGVDTSHPTLAFGRNTHMDRSPWWAEGLSDRHPDTELQGPETHQLELPAPISPTRRLKTPDYQWTRTDANRLQYTFPSLWG